MLWRHAVPGLLAALLLPGFAQAVQAQAASGASGAAPADRSADFRAAEAAAEALQRATQGDLGFATLPPVTANSPRDAMLFEDRRFVNQDPGKPRATAARPSCRSSSRRARRARSSPRSSRTSSRWTT
jgi:hypothetical protein